MAPIHILTCGGTFDKVYLPEQGQLGFDSSAVQNLISDARCRGEIRISELMRIDSLDMTDAHRHQILEAIDQLEEELVIVTHGTDTMIQSAKVVADAKLNKTIVFTGAMIPARLPNSDAPFNLGYAIASLPQLRPGVWVCMNAHAFDPKQCKKNTKLGRFEPLP